MLQKITPEAIDITLNAYNRYLDAYYAKSVYRAPTLFPLDGYERDPFIMVAHARKYLSRFFCQEKKAKANNLLDLVKATHCLGLASLKNVERRSEIKERYLKSAPVSYNALARDLIKITSYENISEFSLIKRNIDTESIRNICFHLLFYHSDELENLEF